MRSLLLALSLTGCATVIDQHSQIADWPNLKVRDNVVSGIEVIRTCYKYLSPFAKYTGTIPMACAEINFAAGTCDIYRAHDADEWIIRHERMHCAGFQHVGDTKMADDWRNYRAYAAGAAIGGRK